MSVTQYIGARYVPLFAEPDQWSSERAYEPLTIVLHEGNSYTSKQAVPIGIDILNTEFWACTGNYNAQVEAYRREVRNLDERITAVANIYETVLDMVANATTEKYAKTLGYYAVNDNGACAYIISETPNSDYSIQLNNGKYATPLLTTEMHPKCFGYENESDSHDILQFMLNNNIVINGKNEEFYLETALTAVDIVCIKNCKFNFNRKCNNFFERVNDTDFTSPTTYFANTVNVNNCEFYNATFSEEQSGPQHLISRNAALPIYSEYAEITNCKFYDNIGNGLMLYGNNSNQFKKVTIDGCIAYNNGEADKYTGIGIGSYINANSFKTNLTIKNCKAFNNILANGISPHGVNNTTISNCHCYNNGEHGFVVQSSTNTTITNCISENNASRNFRIQGDWTDARTFCDNVTIDNCVSVSDKIGRFLQIGYGCNNITVNNNLVYCNNVDWGVDFDAPQYHCSNILITENNFVAPGKDIYTFKMFNGARACHKSIDTHNNKINGIYSPFGGFMVNMDQPQNNRPRRFCFPYRPSGLGVNSYDATNDVQMSGSTQSGNVYTNGELFLNVPITNKLEAVAVVFEGEFTNITSGSSWAGRMYPVFRTANDEYISQQSGTDTTCIFNDYDNKSAILGSGYIIEDVLNQVPNCGILQFRCTIGDGNTFRLDKATVIKY